MSNWLYTEERLKLRADCLGFLLHAYGWKLADSGVPKYSMESLHNCAQDWVSQGNPTTDGLLNYFLQHYATNYTNPG